MAEKWIETENDEAGLEEHAGTECTGLLLLSQCGVGGGRLSLQGNILRVYYSFSNAAMRVTCAQEGY